MSRLIPRLAAAALTTIVLATVMALTLQAGSARSQDPALAQTTSTETVPTPEPERPVCKPVLWKKYKRAVRRTWRHGVSSVGDYHARSKPSMKKRQRLREMRSRCSSSTRQHKMQRYAQASRVEWRFYRRIDRITPYGEWAIPPGIVMCESHGSYTVYNRGGSGASGAYQIMYDTWHGHGGGRYASDAAHAPPWAQHIVARRVWYGQGRTAWSC